MLYDLNIHWSPSTTESQLDETLRFASSLGYDTVAISHTLALPLPPQFKKPLPNIAAATSKASKLPNVLHRATINLAEPAASNFRIPSLFPMYDILAVRPATKDAFNNACLNLDVPIISLDMTQHFPFHFRPKPCMAAVTRGVRFEVCYGQVLAANVDARSRANFISNTSSLIRATGGRGIIISSEAKSALTLRGPADVVNLLSVWGLSNDKGLEALRSVPRGVVVNESVKRTGFRGVVDIVSLPKGTGQEKVAGPTHAAADGQAASQKQTQKRKPGEDESTGGPAISKRQAKKMKLAERIHSDKTAKKR